MVKGYSPDYRKPKMSEIGLCSHKRNPVYCGFCAAESRDREKSVLGTAASDSDPQEDGTHLAEVRLDMPKQPQGDTYEGMPIPSQGEGYPPNWKHCLIHLNPETGEMHSDGDHFVRYWIQEKLQARKAIVGHISVEGREKYFHALLRLKAEGVNPDLAATTALKIMGIG